MMSFQDGCDVLAAFAFGADFVAFAFVAAFAFLAGAAFLVPELFVDLAGAEAATSALAAVLTSTVEAGADDMFSVV
jgi:hypothetical protein